MQYEQTTWYSSRLNRDMTVRVYGHYGYPVIAFPCQDKQSDDWANYGMIDALAPLIESGRLKLFCLDADDGRNCSHTDWDHGRAAYMLEQYFQNVIEEVLPYVRMKQGGDCWPYLVGASMGGSHAANMLFRRPDLFSGFVSLSASYDLARFFHGHFDDNVYNNSVVHYLDHMDPNHHYIGLYNQKRMIVVVGDGAFEYLVHYSADWLKSITDRLGIHVEYNFWDQNSIHDWPSWRYQMVYFLSQLV